MTRSKLNLAKYERINSFYFAYITPKWCSSTFFRSLDPLSLSPKKERRPSDHCTAPTSKRSGVAKRRLRALVLLCFAIMSDPPEKVGELKTEETKEDKAEAAVAEAVQHVVQEVCGPVDEPPPTCPKVAPKKRRLCRYPGCTKVIKSQGHCQRHGARAKRCKVAGCDKQAQASTQPMCFFEFFKFFLTRTADTHRVPMMACVSVIGSKFTSLHLQSNRKTSHLPRKESQSTTKSCLPALAIAQVPRKPRPMTVWTMGRRQKVSLSCHSLHSFVRAPRRNRAGTGTPNDVLVDSFPSRRPARNSNHGNANW